MLFSKFQLQGVAWLLPLVALVAGKEYKYIIPGADLLDEDGVLIQAHGGQIVRHGSKFFWFGEDHTAGGTHFTGISCYSSNDLYNWKNEGHAFSPVAGTQLASDQVGERPKVVYSPEIDKWVMYIHADNTTYGLHLQAMALADEVQGPYALQAIYNPLGKASQDMGLFLDDDGSAYSLYGSGGNNDITILTPDYTNQSRIVFQFSGTNLEAPGMLHSQGVYYNFFSEKTGYRPNDAQYFTASVISGPWSARKQLTPPGKFTFESQNTFELKIAGTKNTTFIFMGDRWDQNELSDSRYMWLPLLLDEEAGTAGMVWHDVWTVDVETGEVGFPEGVGYEAQDGTLTGGANVIPCAGCSQGSLVTNITQSSSVTVSGIVGQNKPQWIALYYVNPDDQLINGLPRLVSVSVNGGAAVMLKQRTTAINVTMSIPFEAYLEKGAVNNITVTGTSAGPAADFDQLIVYPYTP
ncbi:glycosyl hydrolase [Mycena alexandri]|uniref:Glycosyl hydrolase n=1 Tax=Mycena alexandri TaxID=1745969 RepID=A0AAD6TJD0_9AGAR|nr:glycosyl hydrolase [Mycena alexandri]